MSHGGVTDSAHLIQEAAELNQPVPALGFIDTVDLA
jgi:hypothetical protein